MSRNTEQEARNKAFVLEAFEALFNRRDYVAAEKYWSPDYIQHSAHIPPGREGLFALIRGLPGGRLAEHWDVVEDEATEEQSKSGHPMFGSSFPA